MELEQQLKDSFKGISDSLDTTFNFVENDDNQVNDKLQIFEQTKQQLVTLDTKKEVKSIEDKEFLDLTIKKMIEVGLKVLDNVSSEIKIGCKIGKVSEFSEAFVAVLDAVKELKVFKKMVFDMNIEENPYANVKQINNFFGDAKTLLKQINDAKKDSKMNDISEEFNINTDKDD